MIFNMNNKNTALVLLPVLFVVLVGLSIAYSKKISEKEKLPELSYQVMNSGVSVKFSLFGAGLELDSGWRVFSITDLPTGVANKENAETFYSQAGVPWFLDLGITPLAHYALVSPAHWLEISETPSDKLADFGYLGQPPTVRELLREVEVVIMQKERGQSLEQFVKKIDDTKRADAERSYKDGNATESFAEEARIGYFGNFKNREELQTSSPKVQALLLSDGTIHYPDGEFFLLMGCTSGEKVVVVNKGPFPSYSGKVDYLELLRSFPLKFAFNEHFCD